MRFVSRKPTAREVKQQALRTVIKFAWRPISCDDGHTYWFRRIVIEMRAAKKSKWNLAMGGFDHDVPYWKILSRLPYRPGPKAVARLKE